MKTINFMNNCFRCGRSRWGIRFCFWWWRLGRRRKYRRNYDANCKCWKYIIFGSHQKAEYIKLISNFVLFKRGATLWARIAQNIKKPLLQGITSILNFWVLMYLISANSFLPWIVSPLLIVSATTIQFKKGRKIF